MLVQQHGLFDLSWLTICNSTHLLLADWALWMDKEQQVVVLGTDGGEGVVFQFYRVACQVCMYVCMYVCMQCICATRTKRRTERGGPFIYQTCHRNSYNTIYTTSTVMRFNNMMIITTFSSSTRHKHTLFRALLLVIFQLAGQVLT